MYFTLLHFVWIITLIYKFRYTCYIVYIHLFRICIYFFFVPAGTSKQVWQSSTECTVFIYFLYIAPLCWTDSMPWNALTRSWLRPASWCNIEQFCCAPSRVWRSANWWRVVAQHVLLIFFAFVHTSFHPDALCESLHLAFHRSWRTFRFFSRNSLVKTGLWTGSCHFISARFVVCDVHACVCLVFLLLCVCACVCVCSFWVFARLDWCMICCRVSSSLVLSRARFFSCLLLIFPACLQSSVIL